MTFWRFILHEIKFLILFAVWIVSFLAGLVYFASLSWGRVWVLAWLLINAFVFLLVEHYLGPRLEKKYRHLTIKPDEELEAMRAQRESLIGKTFPAASDLKFEGSIRVQGEAIHVRAGEYVRRDTLVRVVRVRKDLIVEVEAVEDEAVERRV